MLYTSWSKPAVADGYYRAEAALGLAADGESWPVVAGDGEPLPWHRMVDFQTALPKVLSTLWVTQPERRAGLERSLADAGNAYAAELGLNSAWTRRRPTGKPEVWLPARLPAGECWLHHISRHLEPHLHWHLLLPLRGRTAQGQERTLEHNLLHAGRYGAAARASAALAAHLRTEGFVTGAVGHFGSLTLRDGPADCDIPKLYALAERWSTGRKTRQTALATAAAQHESLSSDAVRRLDRLVVDRSARPEWQGVEYNHRYGQLLEEYWLREVAITTERLPIPANETTWTGGLSAEKLYDVVSRHDGRVDLRLLRQRAWQLACHDPGLPATDDERARLIDATVKECLNHRPVYTVNEIEGRAEPHAERSRTVGRGLVSIRWLAAANRLRQSLVDQNGGFPRLLLTAGRGDQRVYQPADGDGAAWSHRLNGRVSALIAPAGVVQSDLLGQIAQERIAYLAPPQGLDAAAPQAWLDKRRPLLANDPCRAQPPTGRPGVCVIAAQRRSDLELADMSGRWRAEGWSVLLVIDSDDLTNRRDMRSEALLWARRSDQAAVLECRDMGSEPNFAYGRRHHRFAKLSTGRPSFWESELSVHIVQANQSACGVAQRLDILHALNQPIMVVAPADVLEQMPQNGWPLASWYEPNELLKSEVPPSGHAVLVLDTQPRCSFSVCRSLLECIRLSTHLSVVSPWEADKTEAWMWELRLAAPEQRKTFCDKGWARLDKPDQLQPLREPGALYERFMGRVRY